MMTPKLKNDLLFYMISIHESPELAESEAKINEEKISNLGKYSQMDFSLILKTSGWEDALNFVYENS